MVLCNDDEVAFKEETMGFHMRDFFEFELMFYDNVHKHRFEMIYRNYIDVPIKTSSRMENEDDTIFKIKLTFISIQDIKVKDENKKENEIRMMFSK